MGALPDGFGDVGVSFLNDSGSEFTKEFHDFITSVAWGDIWSRPGLPRHTSSLLTLALLLLLIEAMNSVCTFVPQRTTQ